MKAFLLLLLLTGRGEAEESGASEEGEEEGLRMLIRGLDSGEVSDRWPERTRRHGEAELGLVGEEKQPAGTQLKEEGVAEESGPQLNSTGGERLGLAPGPEPLEAGGAEGEKKHAKRQFFLPPIFPQQGGGQLSVIPVYIPYPQYIEVPRIVMLQSPTCLPGQQPYQPGQQPYQPGQQPGQQPYQPGQQPYQPGQQPYQPGQQPYQPGQQPNQPYLPPDLPGMGPQTPPPPTMSPDIDNRMNMGTMGTGNTTMPRKPSRCVWAIVACCSPDSSTIRYSCFELLGCPGAFWGVNPCEPKIVQAAANTALNFYMAGGQEDGVDSNVL